MCFESDFAMMESYITLRETTYLELVVMPIMGVATLGSEVRREVWVGVGISSLRSCR